jgi:hypothetical protein
MHPFIKLLSYEALKALPLRCTSVDGVELRHVTASGLEYWLHPNGRVDVFATLMKQDKPKRLYSYDSFTVHKEEYEVFDKLIKPR